VTVGFAMIMINMAIGNHCGVGMTGRCRSEVVFGKRNGNENETEMCL